MKNIFLAQQQQLQQCPGIGPKKVRALLAAFQEPFFPDADSAFSETVISSTAAGRLKDKNSDTSTGNNNKAACKTDLDSAASPNLS